MWIFKESGPVLLYVCDFSGGSGPLSLPNLDPPMLLLDSGCCFTVVALWLFLVLIDFWLIVKAVTLIFISGRGSAISSAMEGKTGFIYNLVKS